MLSNLNDYWQKIKLGDELALKELYKQVFPALVSYAQTITGQYHLAEETVQDVMLKIWQNRSVILIQDSFKCYLIKAIHNQALNMARQQKTKKKSVIQPVDEDLWLFIEEHYDVDEQFINQIYAEETLHLIKKAVTQLPKRCKQVFTMSRFEGLSNKEISNKLFLSETTVKTHIAIALQKISELLNERMTKK